MAEEFEELLALADADDGRFYARCHFCRERCADMYHDPSRAESLFPSEEEDVAKGIQPGVLQLEEMGGLSRVVHTWGRKNLTLCTPCTDELMLPRGGLAADPADCKAVPCPSHQTTVEFRNGRSMPGKPCWECDDRMIVLRPKSPLELLAGEAE